MSMTLMRLIEALEGPDWETINGAQYKAELNAVTSMIVDGVEFRKPHSHLKARIGILLNGD